MMAYSLLIDYQAGCQRAALIDDKNQLEALWVTPDDRDALQPGAIVRGKITQRYPALNAATVTIPDHGDVQIKGRDVPDPSATDDVTLQITMAGRISRHDAVPAKLPQASRTLSWAGRGLVYLPGKTQQITRSKRTTDMEEDAARSLLSDFPGHWIIRQRASTLLPAALSRAAAALYRDAQAYHDGARNDAGLHLPGTSATMAALIEMTPPPGQVTIMMADQRSRAAVEAATIALGLDTGPSVIRPGIFAALDLEQAIAQLVQPVVTGDGFRLVIEPTEAFISLDVDLARPSALDHALIACWRQISLRNLSGQILIDLPRQTDWALVRQRLAQLTIDHAEAVQVQIMPGPGLVGLSIPRRRAMLHELLGQKNG